MKLFKEIFISGDRSNIHQKMHNQAVRDHQINKNIYSRLLIHAALGAAVGSGVGYLLNKKLKKNKEKQTSNNS